MRAARHARAHPGGGRRLPGAAFLGAFLLLALLTGCGGDDAGPRTCTWDESRWDECQWAE